MSNHPLSRLLQTCAAVVLVVSILVTIALALDRGQFPRGLMDHVLPATVVLAGGVGLCGLLLGVMGLLEQDRGDAVTRRLLTEIRDQLARRPETPASTPAPSTAAAAGMDISRVVELLEELREVALMDPQQRSDRYERMMRGRREAAAAEVDALTQRGDWGEARTSLERAMSLYGGGNELAAAEERLNTAAMQAHDAAFAELQQRVGDLQATENWAEALAAAKAFASRFVDSKAGRDFLANLQQAHTRYVESTANALFEEVRLDIEQRSWRRALGAAQRLIAKCPDHPRTMRIVQQLDVIRTNAETEQRNAMEARIHEFIKAGRLREAIEVAEDLVQTFPLSPQAQVASQLVVRLRERIGDGAES